MEMCGSWMGELTIRSMESRVKEFFLGGVHHFVPDKVRYCMCMLGFNTRDAVKHYRSECYVPASKW